MMTKSVIPKQVIAVAWVMALLCFSSIIPLVFSQDPCCIQVDINGPDSCTTVAYCNQNEVHCTTDCEGVWTVLGGGPTCIAQGESCSPTAPVQCCEPFACVDAINNIGVCSEVEPTPVPEPTPIPAPITPPPTRVTVPTDGPLRVYYFGHSLIYHTFTDYPDVNNMAVPVWLHRFDGWMADGEFRGNNYQLPPIPQWGFTPDLSVWSANFGASDYDAVVYTELNFVQYKGPSEPYDYDDAFAPTPVASLVRIIDFVNDASVPIYVYECWNGADSIVPDYYPFLGENEIPTEADKLAYYATIDTSSAYHQWWLDLMTAVHIQRPQANIHFVPVSSVLNSVLTTPYLAGVPFVDLFEDNAPHGQPSTYFLAALITYIGITGQAPPASYVPVNDGVLLPEVVDNYNALIDLILDLVETGTPPPAPPVIPPTESPVAPVVGATDTPTASPFAPPSPPTGNDPCCIQFGVTQSYDVCTTVDWCNQAEANCIGDCEGDWVVLDGGGSPPVPNPTASPVTPSPTTAPSSSVTAPPSTGSGGDPCCIQFEITNSYDVCTTVDWCNQEEANCIGDCEGDWVLLGGDSPPAPNPTPSPLAPPATDAPTPPAIPPPTAFPTTSPTSPPTSSVTASPSTAIGGDPCCIQFEITNSYNVCTTVDWCNQAEANCLGPCDGQWEVVGSDGGGNPPPSASPVTLPPTTTTGGSGGDPCCVQEDYAGPGCTTVPYCNENEVNCIGDCEGVWTVVDPAVYWEER